MPEITAPATATILEKVMSKYTVEQVREAVIGFAGYSYSHHGVGSELMAIAEDYSDLLRERESAKAAVTDEMARKANYIYSSYVGSGIESMQAALEAVAPMLASIQSPDMVCEQHPWSEWPHDDCAGPGMPGTVQYEALVYLAKLASARVPDAIINDYDVYTAYENGWNTCRAAMLAAAPKPETGE